MNEPQTNEKLWSPSFAILWQGQLVSTLGDAAYSIALGFWVLAVTGSTALMGMLMAASTLPGVIVAPFAGVLIDRYNRKPLLIMMDFIRGISIISVAIAAYKGIIAVWMVFTAGIMLSICGAIFRPGVNSVIPDLAPKSRLTNANSAFAMVSTGSNMAGNIAGGYLFQALGAPFMFLFNGLSYLFSGVSLFFVSIPKADHKREQHFMNDLKDGVSYVWNLRGLRFMILIAAFMNFFFYIAFVLFLPLFQKTPSLGAGRYGVAMSCFMGGAMVGFILTTIAKIPAAKRFKVFFISNALSSICCIIFAVQNIFFIMLLMLFVGGLFNAIVNVILMSAVQGTTPQNMRGKVLAFLGMVTQGLTPFAMALGGVLGSFIAIRSIMLACFMIVLIVISLLIFDKPFRHFINFDYEKQPLEELQKS